MTPPNKRPRRRSRRPRRSRRQSARRQAGRRLWLWRAGLLAVVALIGYLVYLDLTIRRQFEGQRWALPAHVYTRPLELFTGRSLSRDKLLDELRGLGYRAQAQADRPGTFAAADSRIDLYLRAFTFWDGPRPARRLRLRIRGGRIESLEAAEGAPVELVRLEPSLFGSVSPIHHEDRSLVRLEEVPTDLVNALLAVEDRNFYRHIGIDPRGLARAVWANISAGQLVQGGSTLTQQLIKNFYLTADRTLRRKINEMIMAVLLELHYSKDEILTAYINEVYLGQAGNRAIHGFGLGSQFYFGRPLHELKLPELALLVALVRGASFYNPRRHPQRARERRDLVLTKMVERGLLDADRARSAREAPLGVPRRGAITATAYPAFLDLVRRQLLQDYRDEDLKAEGLRIFTTLDPAVQRRAEQAVARRLEQLEQSGALTPGQLEAAVIVVRSDNGEVLAVVGGRAARFAGFNRALDAERPVGSLIKPAVYLTALEQQQFSLASLLDDSPLTVSQRGAPDWRPQNYDQTFRGPVLLLDSLAQSYNVPSARLGLAVGVPEVIALLERLGIRRQLPPYPSLLLGAVAMSPLEMAQMYLTFASGGFRLPLKSVRSVLTHEEEPLARYPLAIEQVIEPAPMALLTHALQEVVRSGTARGLAQRLDSSLGLAGKTGTTDGFRDSWYAGYSGDLMALVWVGRDDNGPTGLTGARGAMRIWADVMAAHDLQPLLPVLPDNVQLLAVDDAGRLAEGCDGARDLPFIVDSVPAEYAPCATARVGGRSRGKIKRFFERLFESPE